MNKLEEILLLLSFRDYLFLEQDTFPVPKVLVVQVISDLNQ